MKVRDNQKQFKDPKNKSSKGKQIFTIVFSFFMMTLFVVTSSVTYAAYVQSIKNSYKYNSETKLISSTLGGGQGTLGSPFRISNATHLKNLSKLVTLGVFDEKTVFVLTNDIYWDQQKDGVLRPIGNNDNPFVSKFDGQGKVISNLVVYGDNTADIGMFGYCGDQSVVKNFLLQYPRVVVRSNTLPISRSGKDRVNANPLDEIYGDFARGLYDKTKFVYAKDGYNLRNLPNDCWLTKEGEKNKDNVQFYNSYIKLPLYAYANDNSQKTKIHWTTSNTSISRIEYDENGNPYLITTPLTNGNPSSVKVSFYVSGDIYGKVNDTYQKYNLERYQINILGTGKINEETAELKTKEKISLGCLKTIHNPTIIKESPISVGLFIGRTDGRASHLGMVGGKDNSLESLNSEKGIIQVQGRGAYSYSTLIGRTRITENLDTISGGSELNITYDMSSLDPADADYTQRDKVASCWPDPNNVPRNVDVNGKVYMSLQQYDEQQKRANSLTQLYIDPAYKLDYKTAGFINYPKNDGTDSLIGDLGYNLKRLAGDKIDYHHYDYNKFDNRKDGFRDGSRYNTKLFPQCKLVDVQKEHAQLVDRYNQPVHDKFAVKFNGGLGASTYSWYSCIPDNFNGDLGAEYATNDWNLYQNRWNGWQPSGWFATKKYKHYSDQFHYRSWQLYGHAPDTVNHNDGELYPLVGGSENDPQYGYYWTHLARDFAINNGIWMWATKEKTPVVYEGNKYDVSLRIKYFAENTQSDIPTNKYNFKILYNHYNPDAMSYLQRPVLNYYYYHLSYFQNLMWYELNNPYNDSEKNTSGKAHSKNGYIIPDDLNQNLYNPKEHPIIDDGKVHYEKIKFSYEKQNNRGIQEYIWLGDRCEWFPCFALGMGKVSEQGRPYSGKYNDGGPAMGAYYNHLGSYEKYDQNNYNVRKNKQPIYKGKPLLNEQGENAIWDRDYLFYNAGRFQTWNRFGGGEDGITGLFDSSANTENKSHYNDEGFFNTQYTTDEDISLYILKADATFTSKAGNDGELIHHVDFLTGVSSVTYDKNDEKFTRWNDIDSEAKPKFNVEFEKNRKDQLISFAFGRTGNYGMVYGYYTDKNYPIYRRDQDIGDSVNQFYSYSGNRKIKKY